MTRRLSHTAAEDLLGIVIRRDEKASTLITSNRPEEDWGELRGDTVAARRPFSLLPGPASPAIQRQWDDASRQHSVEKASRHHVWTLTMKYFNTFYVCSAWHRACSYGRMGLEEVRGEIHNRKKAKTQDHLT